MHEGRTTEGFDTTQPGLWSIPAAWQDRNQQLDPQLPALDGGSGAWPIAELDAESTPLALGRTTEVLVTEDNPEALWGALQRDRLELRWGGDTAALGRLLDRWIARVSGDLGPEDECETAMSVSVPARDSAAAIPLLSRGFAVVGVTGIRVGASGANATSAESRLASAGFRLRQADEADLPLLGELDAELLAHDALHGHVTVRPRAAELLRPLITARLARDPEWTWVLEDADGPAGYLSIEVGREHHVAECAAGTPVAHIQAMYLRQRVRGGGIGDAVVEFGHGRLESAGLDRITLGYAALNPRSGPFWCRQGYRPLWNDWQRRPAF